jgi:lipid A ethanolaminephosphotransferase
LFDYLPPYNYVLNSVNGTADYIKTTKETKEVDTNGVPVQPTLINISDDSKMNFETKKKNLIVYLIGETTRAKNIGFNGYERNTTEILDNKGIINFEHFYSCGTSTFNSIPCLFAFNNKMTFREIINHENYLDIFKKFDFELDWVSNNGSCKGVCWATNYEDIRGNGDDINLLTGLEERIDGYKGKNTILYLHMRGSHGPSYYTRYPEEYEFYKPACHERQIRKCSDKEITNAYDNSIKYNMFVISKIMEILETKQDEFNIGLIFMSDHGESLGEKGFYLHGGSYILTKEEQGRVGAFMWFSNDFLRDFKLDKTCLVKEGKTSEFTHYNMFSSMLGLFKIENKYYKKDMDIFRKCRQ